MYKILVIDDEVLIRMSVIKIIKNGIEDRCVVEECDNPIDGVRLIKEFNPDVIVTDIFMGQMSGLDMVNAVKPSAKLIFITGYRKFEYAKQAIDLKAFSFILKPIDQQELLKAVADAILSLKEERSDGETYMMENQYMNEIPILKDGLYEALEKKDLFQARQNLEKIMNLFLNRRDEIPIDYIQQTCIAILVRINVLRSKIDNDTTNLEMRISNIKNIIGSSDDVLDYKYVLDVAIENLFKNIELFNKEKFSGNVRKALDFIDENYQKGITLYDVAEYLQLSSAHTSRIFKKETGKNLIDYVNEKKMEKAKEMLLKSKFKVNDIARMLGFEYAQYFSAIFKKYTGLSPTEFLEQNEQL